jgi:hypothetical protein
VIYITAVYGPRHAAFFRGLAASWPKATREPLVVFTDQPLTSGAGLIVDRSVSQAELEDSLPGRHFYTKKVLLAHRAAKRWKDDVCWIDADSVVFVDLAKVLVAGKLNAVSYGKPGELRPCGEGVVVPQENYLLNGLVSAPRELFEEWERAVRSMPAGGMEGCPEMEAWNRLAVADPKKVEVLDRSHPELVWNLPHEHPTPENKAWTGALALEGETLTLDGRKFAVLQWVSSALGKHLEREFYDIPHLGARRALKELYGLPEVPEEASVNSPFNVKVNERRNGTPWARMSLESFARDMAVRCASRCASMDTGEHGVALTVASGWNTGMRYVLSWCGPKGRRLEVASQDLDLVLWKAAELESEGAAQ